MTQCDERIHEGGPASWHECGGNTDDCRHRGNGDQRHRIDARTIHRDVADADVVPCRRRAQRKHGQHGQHETDARARSDEPCHSARDAPDHLLTPSAERHADADLTGPPRNGKRDDRIKTDAGECQAENAEAP
jgi:hypothetical protein